MAAAGGKCKRLPGSATCGGSPNLRQRGVAELKQVVALSAGGPAATPARRPLPGAGLSYYTGPIFRIEFPGLSGSGGGGGRYDDLIGMFSGRRSRRAVSARPGTHHPDHGGAACLPGS